jgi:hypothetical protein
VSGGGVRELSEETRLKMCGRTGPMSPNFGKKFSEEHRKRISLAKLGQKYRPMAPESRQRIADSNRGKKRSEWHKQRIRESKLGVPCSPETKEKLRLINLGKKYSEETKRKKSETSRARITRSTAKNTPKRPKLKYGKLTGYTRTHGAGSRSLKREKKRYG